uniref:CSON015420 protein n=2 Tax=Culicoides sonorensis TaxID=179676 RepID=A0A336LSR5_CULSO
MNYDACLNVLFCISHCSSVLLFPPVNNYRRFLIHKICDNLSSEYDICTFSIGQNLARRTVVCFKNQLKFPEKLQKSTLQSNSNNNNYYQNNSWRSSVEKPSEESEHLSWRSSSQKYVREESYQKKNINFIYKDSKTYRLSQLGKSNESRETAIETHSTQNQPSKTETTNAITSTALSAKTTRTRRPDRAVYVPRARRSQTTPRSSSVKSSEIESSNTTTEVNKNQKRRSDPEDYHIADNQLENEKSNSIINKISIQEKKFNYSNNKESECAKKNFKNLSIVKQKTIDNSDCDLLSENNCDTNFTKTSEVMAPHKKSLHFESAKIENVTRQGNNKKDDDELNREENELRKVSQEINRKSRRIIKQTFNSDVLEIGCGTEESGKAKVTDSSEESNNVSAKFIETKEVNPEEDDWENMFDESGDCLDPKIMDELTAQVGKVTIEKPKTDYKLYQTKQALLLEEEFPHVLEVSNFPCEFKTQDLIMTFSAYKESGFDIKWVDDTHALVVFSNSKIAAEVLSTNHAFVKLKPLKEATAESRNKAKKCSTSLQPYRQRPETCAALARRLVTGALGVRLKTAREERENERRILNEARERKLLAAKQSDEIWES